MSGNPGADFIIWYIGAGFSAAIALLAVSAALTLLSWVIGAAATAAYNEAVRLAGNVRAVINILAWVRAGKPPAPEAPPPGFRP